MMKKITLSLLFAAALTSSFAQNVITNSDFEDTTLYPIIEGDNVAGTAPFLPRIEGLEATESVITHPTLAAPMAIADGLWTKKAGSTGYIKAYVLGNYDPMHKNVLSFFVKSGGNTANLDNMFSMLVMQEIASTLDVTKSYTVTFDACIDNTTFTVENSCTEVGVMLYDRTTQQQIETIVPLTTTTGFATYTATFDLPTAAAAGFTGEEVRLALSIRTTYKEPDNSGKVKTNLSGIFLDNVMLTPATELSLQESVETTTLVRGEEGAIFIAASAGSSVTLYTIGGAQMQTYVMSSNEARFVVESGIYLVQVAGKTYKAVVR